MDKGIEVTVIKREQCSEVKKTPIKVSVYYWDDSKENFERVYIE